jgi:uncharacterized protein
MPAARLPALARGIYLALALLFLALGILGAFLPVLPTTPFILLSAWAAARGSPRLLDWLENHSAFGPMLRDWRCGGVVGRKAKWTATVFMSVSGAYLLLAGAPRWVAWLAIACMGAVALWLWRRPERLPDVQIHAAGPESGERAPDSRASWNGPAP